VLTDEGRPRSRHELGIPYRPTDHPPSLAAPDEVLL
jgi:hypothetical protein